jgi:hypothetical protein
MSKAPDNASGAELKPPKIPSDDKLYDAACDFDECKTYGDIVGFGKRLLEERDALWSGRATRLLAQKDAELQRLRDEIQRLKRLATSQSADPYGY